VDIEFCLEKHSITALLLTNIPSKKHVQWLRRSGTDLGGLNSATDGVVKYHTLNRRRCPKIDTRYVRSSQLMNALLACRVDTKQQKSSVPLCWAMHVQYHYLIYVVCTLTSGSSYRRSYCVYIGSLQRL